MSRSINETRCSRPCCGNPRRWFGDVTRAEERAALALGEGLADHEYESEPNYSCEDCRCEWCEYRCDYVSIETSPLTQSLGDVLRAA